MAFIPSTFNVHRDIKYSEFTWKKISIIPPSISLEKCFGKPLKRTTSGGDAALKKAPMCSYKSPWPSSLCSPKPHLPTCPGDEDTTTWVMRTTCAEVTRPLDVIPFSLKWRAGNYFPGRIKCLPHPRELQQCSGARSSGSTDTNLPPERRILSWQEKGSHSSKLVLYFMALIVPYWRRSLTTTLHQKGLGISMVDMKHRCAVTSTGAAAQPGDWCPDLRMWWVQHILLWLRKNLVPFFLESRSKSLWEHAVWELSMSEPQAQLPMEMGRTQTPEVIWIQIESTGA